MMSVGELAALPVYRNQNEQSRPPHLRHRPNRSGIRRIGLRYATFR